MTPQPSQPRRIPAKRTKYDKLFRDVRRAFSRSQWLICAKLGVQATREFPDESWAWMIYGEALSKTGRHRAALAALQTAVKVGKKRGLRLALTQLGKHFVETMQPEQARRAYRRAAAAGPGHASPLIYLGCLEMGAGRFAQAESALRRAVRCKEGCIEEAYYNLGATLALTGKMQEARACLRRALRIDPRYKCARQFLRQLDELSRISAKA